MKSPLLKIESWPIENLIPYDLNAKKHDSEQIARIATAIRRHGWDVPIVVDKLGVIIKGHGRRLAAIELGMTKVPVLVRTDLTPLQVRAARLSDNRVAISDLDPELLRTELASLDPTELTGIFDTKEIEFLGADLGDMSEDAFVTDMGVVLEEQKADIEARTEAAIGEGVRVPLAKAFGFKDVAAGGQIALASMMSKVEASTGLRDDAALVAFARSFESTEKVIND